MIEHTGWLWEYTQRHMDLHRYAAMRRHWRRSPPLQAMVQQYLGIEGKDPPRVSLHDEPVTRPMTAAEEELAIADFARAFAAAGGIVH